MKVKKTTFTQETETLGVTFDFSTETKHIIDTEERKVKSTAMYLSESH